MASLAPYNATLGRRLAIHLLRRGTYRFTAALVDDFASKTVSEAVESLLTTPNRLLDEPLDWETGDYWVNLGVAPISPDFRLRQYTSGWWIDEASHDNSIRHKLIFFLHQNFIVNAQSGSARQFYDYLQMLFYFSTRSYKELAKKMTIDNTMLRYLNGTQNTDNNPNENYAREFFELFTIGKGSQIGPGDYTNYTEDDIQEASKLLSGFKQTNRPLGGDPLYFDNEIKVQLGRAQYSQHDTSDKTFSAAFGSQTITGAVDADDMFRELDDFVEMVFGEIETARNICRKLYRYFVRDKISEEVETDIIQPLAQTLFDNDYELLPTISQLLKSEHFYDQDDSDATDNIVASIVKSPLEILAPTISFFEIDIPDPFTDGENHYHNWYKRTVRDTLFIIAGFNIHNPDSVAGYPAYYQEPGFSENWFNGSTLIPRYKNAEVLLTGERVLQGGDNGGVQLDIVDFVANSGLFSDPSDGTALLTTLTDYLFAEPLTAERFTYFLNDIFLDELSLINWFFEWQNYVNTQDDSSVKIPLERLFTALISSQEYQLM